VERAEKGASLSIFHIILEILKEHFIVEGP